MEDLRNLAAYTAFKTKQDAHAAAVTANGANSPEAAAAARDAQASLLALLDEIELTKGIAVS